MKGWLVVNSFVDSTKFSELYELLLEAAKKQNMCLQLVKSWELAGSVSELCLDREMPDFVIFWDKDILLAKQLEAMGIRLFNSSKAIYYCDNKAETYLQLAKANIPIPKTIIAPKTFEGLGYTEFSFLKKAIQQLGLPMVIKECYGSFGQQVYLVNDEEEAKAVIAKIGHKDFVMQEFVCSSCGRDLRINVVGHQAVASMLRHNEKDFRSNVTNGGVTKTYTPSKEQEKLAVACVEALGLDFAGVDVMFGPDDAPIACEVNSNPHFKSTLDCTGIDLADHIIQYIISELK